MLKRVLKWIGIGLAVLVVLGVGFAYVQASAFDASVKKVYDVPPLAISASTDPTVIDRGKHLAESLGGCMGCHGDDLGGKEGEAMGPLGQVHGTNLTAGAGGIGKKYSDGQFARLLRHGIKADGTSLRFMPAPDFAWWPDADVAALISYIRSLPPVDRNMPEGHVGVLGKVLDRFDIIPLDVARRIDHTAKPAAVPAPAPTAEYGAYIGRLCTGCHGTGLSGGPIPGAPADLPVPANITLHETGIKLYTEADFIRMANTGIKRDGTKINPFMPLPTLAAMNDIEKRALWAYLSSLPPKPFGGR